MNSKSILQIFLFALILLISYLVFKNYFSEVEVKETLNKTVLRDSKDRSDSSEDSSSIIENLEYKSIDSRGNKYIVKSELGETKLENQNILILQKVNAKINLIKKSPVLIFLIMPNIIQQILIQNFSVMSLLNLKIMRLKVII